MVVIFLMSLLYLVSVDCQEKSRDFSLDCEAQILQFLGRNFWHVDHVEHFTGIGHVGKFHTVLIVAEELVIDNLEHAIGILNHFGVVGVVDCFDHLSIPLFVAFTLDIYIIGYFIA